MEMGKEKLHEMKIKETSEYARTNRQEFKNQPDSHVIHFMLFYSIKFHLCSLHSIPFRSAARPFVHRIPFYRHRVVVILVVFIFVHNFSLLFFAINFWFLFSRSPFPFFLFSPLCLPLVQYFAYTRPRVHIAPMNWNKKRIFLSIHSAWRGC